MLGLGIRHQRDNGERPDEVTSVAIGGIETCITVADGRVFCWDYGETRAERMTQVANIRDAVKVSVGNDSACVLHLGGGVSCWGNNNVGQVGDGTTTRRSAPVRLSSITDAEDISVSSGSSTVGGSRLRSAPEPDPSPAGEATKSGSWRTERPTMGSPRARSASRTALTPSTSPETRQTCWWNGSTRWLTIG